MFLSEKLRGERIGKLNVRSLLPGGRLLSPAGARRLADVQYVQKI